MYRQTCIILTTKKVHQAAPVHIIQTAVNALQQYTDRAAAFTALYRQKKCIIYTATPATRSCIIQYSAVSGTPCYSMLDIDTHFCTASQLVHAFSSIIVDATTTYYYLVIMHTVVYIACPVSTR